MGKISIVTIGERYNNLTIISEGRIVNKKTWVECICDCGNKTFVSLNRIKSGCTKSCGCLRRKSRKLTQEHKEKIARSNTGKRMSLASRYKNMKNSLNYEVSLEWLLSFTDIDKLRFLNKMVAKDRLDNDEYILFIEKYYYNSRFNLLYENWLNNNKEKYLKPSLDHIIPSSKGGTTKLENLQILTWFENKCKNDLTQEKWNYIKCNIEDYLK